MPNFHSSTGTVNAVMLFVDFADADHGAETPTALYDMLVPPAQNWFGDVSYGRVQLSVEKVDAWYRMPNTSVEYGFADGLSFDEQRHYIQDALTAADADVNFTQYDEVYVVAADTPNIPISPAFIAVLAGQGVTADGHEIRYGATFGHDVRVGGDYGAHVLAHETSHTFGLPDLYAFGASNFADTFRFAGPWDNMSAVQPGAHLLEWHKWKLGWIDDSQVACLPDGQTTHTLVSASTAGGVKAIVVPTGTYTATVVEARAASGHDSGLCEDGVLIYTVDTRIATGAGPIRVVRVGNDDPDKISVCYPTYHAALSTSVGRPTTYAAGGLTVTLNSVDVSGDSVTVAYAGPPYNVAITAPVAAVQLVRSFTVRWTATDAEGVAGYDVRFRRSTYATSLSSTFTLWKSSVAGTSAVFGGTTGATYCFSVRARDPGGHVSGWSSQRCTSVPLDDRSLTRSGPWISIVSSSAYLRTLSRSSSRGAKLTRLGVRASHLYIVARTCSSCGTIDVVHGSFRKRVSLRTTTTYSKRVILTFSLPTSYYGTLRIYVYTAGKPVYIDGVGVSPV